VDYGWSDEEIFTAIPYNLRIHFALGYEEFGIGFLKSSILYYFRKRLS
jgi:hypothetical protein